MFGFKKKKKPENPPSLTKESSEEQAQEVTQNPSEDTAISTPDESAPQEAASAQTKQEKPKGLFSRLKQGLSKTSSNLSEGMGTIILGKKEIDDEVMEELETRLLMADVGMEATQRIVADMTKKVKRHQLWDQQALFKALQKTMAEVLKPISQELVIPKSKSPFVILMVGINGAGKTTTIGKMAKKFQQDGKSVMLAAGDTFRAAAVEQLQTWGERNQIPVVAQATGADTASVIYDAVESAKANNIDVLLADTAGRLHTQDNLMEELKKVKRVIQKLDANAPHEIMLIVDASIGQNALLQAKEFNEALGLTGISVTKLDGTAKGGILFAIAEQTGIPVRFIGVGEAIDDLQVFNAEAFVEALLGSAKTT